jgi:hypothetical protein
MTAPARTAPAKTNKLHHPTFLSFFLTDPAGSVAVLFSSTKAARRACDALRCNRRRSLRCRLRACSQ